MARTRESTQSSPKITVSCGVFARAAKDVVLVPLILLLGIATAAASALAASPPAVQLIEGRIDALEVIVYRLKDLTRGDTLEILVQNASGDLDPNLILIRAPVDTKQLLDDFADWAAKVASEGGDPRSAIDAFAKPRSMMWNDDRGASTESYLAVTVPDDGEYMLIVRGGGGRFAEGMAATFGRYRLIAAVNPVADVSASAETHGPPFAFLDSQTSRGAGRIQEITGSLSPDHPSAVFRLVGVEPGETIQAFVTGKGGGPPPQMRLVGYSGKVLGAGRLTDAGDSETLEFGFGAPTQRVTLHLEARPNGSGDFRLLLGLNAPEVVEGTAAARGTPVVRPPVDVRIGSQVDQITSVNQKEENFGVVADLRMQWTDRAYAFSPDSCQCRSKTFDEAGFTRYLEEREGIWPQFVLFNQQGNRWSQRRMFVVKSDGSTTYFERFTATLQAPDFNFQRFPFDAQTFYVRILSLYPEDTYRFVADPELSGLGTQLGEEEWIFGAYTTSVATVDGASQFNYRLTVDRHVSYYALRIFLPLALIVLVSWFTFFLKDYGKRIDITGANLLLFIAFSFTISTELPRLGYITLLDSVMISAFVVGALLIVLNVYLKRQEAAGRIHHIQRIDRYMLALYPLAYFLPWLVLSLWLGRH